MSRFLMPLLVGCMSLSTVAAEKFVANYDESKVPRYTLPDPLRMEGGGKVESAEMWTKSRRPELLKLFEEHVYGKSTLDPVKMQYRIFDTGTVFDGKGTRRQYELTFYLGDVPSETDPKVCFLVYTPNRPDAAKSPMFLGLTFVGNHAVSDDPAVRLGPVWDRKAKTVQTAEEKDRGAQSRRWPLQRILDRGFAVGTAYHCDFEPDFDGGIRYGVRRLLYPEGTQQRPDEANTIATWAWGLSRLLDLVVAEQDVLRVDPDRVAVFGHSRLGKTALWAGATDPRFALVVSNNSGCGGAALSRREVGETVARINTVFPYWFCDNFKQYGPRVATLPVDQHELVALIAPRPVYIASASKDLWADPRGEFLSALHADPVYRLLGTNGFGDVRTMPEVDHSVGDRIGYHLREGKHDILEFDWIQYMNFFERNLRPNSGSGGERSGGDRRSTAP